MGNGWASSRDVHMGRLLQVVEESLAVTHLAELDLKLADPEWSALRTHQWMHDNHFDAAPLDEPEPHRVVVAGTLRPNSRPVREQAGPIDSTLLVSADLSLADGIARLASRPFYFVLQRDQLRGIVTRADLQRPAVAMILFSMILASESAMSVVIDRRLGDAWIEQLRAADRESVDQIFKARVRTNTEVTRLECLMLNQRLDLLAACPGALADLGFSSRKDFKKWKERLRGLRDTLAHGGGLLHAEPDPLHAIGLFEAVRSFADRVWGVV